MFNHPKNVCMSYWSHFRFAMYLSFEFAKASVVSLIHAIYPDIFVTYATDTVKKLTIDMHKVGCRDK